MNHIIKFFVILFVLGLSGCIGVVETPYHPYPVYNRVYVYPQYYPVYPVYVYPRYDHSHYYHRR